MIVYDVVKTSDGKRLRVMTEESRERAQSIATFYGPMLGATLTVETHGESCPGRAQRWANSLLRTHDEAPCTCHPKLRAHGRGFCPGQL